jgi:hypothetical protein
MAATSDDLLAFAARSGNKVLQEQVKLKAPVWEALEKVKMTGAVGIVNPIVAGQSSAKFIGDGAARSSGSSNTPVQGVIHPAFVDAPLVLNNGALMVLTGREDSANYLDSQLKSAGATLAQVIGSSIYAPAGQITSISAVVSQFAGAPATATVTVPSPAGLKEGMSVTLVDDSADRAFIVRVAAVELDAASLGANVTLVNDVPGVAGTGNNTNAALIAITFAAGDDIFQRGTLTNEGVNAAAAAASLGPVSLSDLAGTGAVYGISQAQCTDIGFVGNTFTSVGDASQEAFLLRMKRVAMKSGDMPDLICVSPITAGVLGFSAITPATAGGLTDAGQSRRAVDGKLDKYGRDIISDSGVSLGGKRVLEDVNLADDTAYLVNKEFTKVALWQDVQAEKQGGDTLLVKQDAFSKVAFFNAAFNLMCTKRSTLAKLSGITVTL